MTSPILRSVAVAALAATLLPALAAEPNLRPPFLRGPIAEAFYDGVGDDLLTAGLGKSGLMGAAPAFANPLAPTAAELRRNAIYVNYRALVDPTAAGGMGVFYGPNVDLVGEPTMGEGKIAGNEFIAWADDGSGRRNVTLMVQVPASFDPAAPCIVTATSSGSRGVYGAVATAGEWGLKHRCAVAYADKGSGNGMHDLAADIVTLRNGTTVPAATAGIESQFTADLGPADLAAFNAAWPNRVAFKHAHSKQNPEKDWGRHTLDAVRFAFYVLNERFGAADPARPGGKLQTITKANTVVIASSVSNGGGAALAAAEQDDEGLIDGVAVSEPNVQPRQRERLKIRQGATPVATVGAPLADYFSFANVYQPCAALAAGLSVSPLFWPAAYTTSAQNRCAALAAKGLVKGATTAEQAADALAKMRAYGWPAETDFLQQSHYRFATNAIAVTYTNAHGRFGVEDRLCGFGFANTNAAGDVVAQNPFLRAAIFANGNGVPPTSGVNVVYDDALGGPKLDFLAVSPSSGTADFALDGALCQRALVTGRDEVTGKRVQGEMKAKSDRVREGIEEVLLEARLGGKPTIIVAGRNDTLVPVNHAARAYFAASQRRGPKHETDSVRYVEVVNAQHFDSFIGFGALLGYDARFIPLHVYFNRAMDAMWAHLTAGAPLPPSQVVRAVPRGSNAGVVPPLRALNLPPISPLPAAADLIGFEGPTLVVPD